MIPHGNNQINIEDGTFCKTVGPVYLTSGWDVKEKKAGDSAISEQNLGWMTFLTKQFPRAFCDIQRHWAIDWAWEKLKFIFVEVVDYLANKSVFKDFLVKMLYMLIIV